MTTAMSVAPYYTETLLDRDNELLSTCSRFLSDAEALANLLPDAPMVTNLAKDRYRFLVGFVAALVRRQTMLLPPRRMPWASSIETMPLPIVLSMTRNKSNIFPPIRFLKCRLNPTCTGKVPQIPIDQPAVMAFASDSTGNPHSYSNTWGSLVTVPQSTGSHLRLKASDPMTIVAIVPHQHAYGLETSVMHPFYSKGDS
jgi:acyl-coenzyme A synthetase/AMP-(fatty) acid ligase